MSSFEEAADFLRQKRIAVAGVSRKGSAVGNIIYRKLRESGHEVFPVNPNAAEVERDRCYPDLGSIPERVDAVVIATHPRAAIAIVQQCIALGIPRVWLHRSLGQGSVDPDAVRLARANGITVLAGGCPMMFCEPVDLGHRCLRWWLSLTGGLSNTT